MIIIYMSKTSTKRKRKTNKRKRTYKKRKVYRGGIYYDTPIHNYIHFLTSTNLSPCNIDQNDCKTPKSKSKRQINICTNKTFKGPYSTYTPYVNVNIDNSTINVDANVMNVFVQAIIKKIYESKPLINQIEHYDQICVRTDKAYALEGRTYHYKDHSDIFSVEDFIIKIVNDSNNDSDNDNDDANVKILLGWILNLFQILDDLYNKIQFHHCDPKAAQLFLNGETLILGDLDKVTFTVSLYGKPYRVNLGTHNVIMQKGIEMVRSVPETMRYESKPRDTCDYEKACFVSSILLLIRNENVRQKIMNSDNENITRIMSMIMGDEINQNIKKNDQNQKTDTYNYDALKKHSTASKCVKKQKPTFTELKSIVNII